MAGETASSQAASTAQPNKIIAGKQRKRKSAAAIAAATVAESADAEHRDWADIEIEHLIPLWQAEPALWSVTEKQYHQKDKLTIYDKIAAALTDDLVLIEPITILTSAQITF